MKENCGYPSMPMETLVKRNGMLREETRPKATGFANECDAIIVENQTGSVRTQWVIDAIKSDTV